MHVSEPQQDLPDPEMAFKLIEHNFIYKDGVRSPDSAVAKKLKRYCAFLYFYFTQAEEKYRMFDTLRPELNITEALVGPDDARMTIWWWAYLDVIVHTSNLYDKSIGSNEPASLFYLNRELPAWAAELGVTSIPELSDLSDNDSLKSLLGLRDKLVIHVEPKYYFATMLNLRDVPNLFENLLNEIAKPYLESVYGTFFEHPVSFIPKDDAIQNMLKLGSS